MDRLTSLCRAAALISSRMKLSSAAGVGALCFAEVDDLALLVELASGLGGGPWRASSLTRAMRKARTGCSHALGAKPYRPA
jgi:hypothetical protein